MRRTSIYLRDKSIELNIENMNDILFNNAEANYFLYEVKNTDYMNTQDAMYIEILCVIADNEYTESNLEQIMTEHKTDMREIKKVLQKIITDYNTLYLDDKYYNGYWHNGICYEKLNMKTVIPLPER
jgi:hypothetical protein